MVGCLVLAAALAACSPQATEQEMLDRARLAMEQGKDRAAVIDVKTVLQQNPDNAPARRLLGEIYLFQQIPAAAAEEFERALAAGGDDDVRVLYARALVTAGRGDRLLELDDQKSYASIAENPQYLAALARAQATAGDLLEAENSMAAAFAAAPDDPYVATSNASFLLLHMSALEEARAALQDTLALHPEHVEAWSLLGGIQHVSGEFDLAETSYARVAELNPYRIMDRLNLVTVRMEQDKTAAAETELKRLLASNPDHPGVNFIEGRRLLESGDNVEALEAFSKVLNQVPAHEGSLYLAAIANIREEHFATALGQLNRFLTIQPDHLNGRLLLTNLYLLMDDPVAAEGLARSILKGHETNYSAMALLVAALNAQGSPGAGGGDESIDLHQRMVTARPEAVAPRLALGAALLQAGDGDGAIAQFQAARDLAPESGEAWERLIQAQLSGGDTAAAKTDAEAYAGQDPQNPRPSLFLGRIALQENDTPAAGAHFERALELDPGNVIANRGLAVLASADKDLDEARARYMDALAHHPDDTASLLNLAAIEGARGDFRAMEGNLETAVRGDTTALAPRLSLARLKLQEGRGAEAVRLLTAVRDDYPREPGLWLLLTEAQLAVGDLASASEAGQHLLGLLPDDAIALATVARVELRSRQFNGAEKHLRQALALQPDNGNFQKLLIDALMGQGKLEEASTLLAELPEEVAGEPAVHVARGRIALAWGRPAEAESHLRDAMDKSPATMTLLWLSGAIAAQDRDDEATELLNDWLADNPEDVLVRNQLASSYLQLGREREAREHYQYILEKAPNNVLILNNLAWLLRSDDPQQALAYIEKANGLAPDNPQILDTYAMIQLGRGARHEALSLNQEALELLPDNPQILYHRAMILHADGQGEEATRILERLVDVADFARREEAQAFLAEWQGL